MATERLTLFDVIADLIPGIVLLLFLSPGIQTVVNIGNYGLVGTALIIVAIGYPAGRIIHAAAARKRFSKQMANSGWSVGSVQLDDVRDEYISDLHDEENPIQFKFPIRVKTLRQGKSSRGETDSIVGSYEHKLTNKMLDLAEAKYDYPNDTGKSNSTTSGESDEEYLEHLGHSILHGNPSLYLRYTILATFYRNLWFSTRFGAPVFILLMIYKYGLAIGNTTETITTIIFLVIFGIGYLWILELLSVRWLEFRYRRLRAFINELYLHLDQFDPDT